MIRKASFILFAQCEQRISMRAISITTEFMFRLNVLIINTSKDTYKY